MTLLKKTPTNLHLIVYFIYVQMTSNLRELHGGLKVS